MNRRYTVGAFLLMLSLAIVVSIATAQEKAKPVASPDVELVADVFPSQEGKHPTKIAIRNFGFATISSEQCMEILMRCYLHISKPDGSEGSRPIGGWRGQGPHAIQRGDLASHYVIAPIEDLFKMDQDGRYLVWWTDGDRKSNVLVFQKDAKGLQRLPNIEKEGTAPPANVNFTCVVFDQKEARTVLKGQIEAQQFKKWFKEDYAVAGERIEPPADAVAFGCLVVTDGEELFVMPLCKWGTTKQQHFACQLHEIGRAPMFSVVTDSEEALIQKMKAALEKMGKTSVAPLLSQKIGVLENDSPPISFPLTPAPH